jgi:hypothetical protein
MCGEGGRNKIAKHFEETHKVKRRIYFVKRRFLQGGFFPQGLKPNFLTAISQA